MIQELYELVHQMEQGKLENGLVDKSEVVERLRVLFELRERRIPQDRAAIFDHLFLNLSDGINVEARRKLAQTLSKSQRSPMGIVEKLAIDDDIEVAGPILRSAIEIREQILEVVASTKGNLHLKELARKANLQPSITATIASRGDDDTIIALATNQSAIISSTGIEVISQRAMTNSVLRNITCVRPDLPAADFSKLMALDAAFVCRDFDIECAVPDYSGIDVINIIVAAFEDGISQVFSHNMIKASFDYVAMKAIRQSLNEEDFLRWTRRRQFEDAIAGLAIVSAIPPEYLQRLISVPTVLPAAILFKAVGFNWATMKSFMLARAKNDEIVELPREIYDVFDSVEAETARRIMRHAALHKKIAAFPALSDAHLVTYL
jgi:hypothetical protein